VILTDKERKEIKPIERIKNGDDSREDDPEDMYHLLGTKDRRVGPTI
jgi:type I restriction enzyme R subunit